MKDPLGLYAALGITPDGADALTQEGFKAAYRKRAKETHPDREGGDADAFAKVQAAYDVLGDPEKRATYDATGAVDQSKIDEGLRDAINVVERTLNGFFEAIERTEEPVFPVNPIENARKIINADIRALKELIEKRRRISVRLADAAKRFSADEGTTNYPLRMIEYRLTQIAHANEKAEEEIALNERALPLLDHLHFRCDEEGDVVKVQMRRLSMSPGALFFQPG